MHSCTISMRGVGAVLTDYVEGEVGAFVSGSPGTQGLTDRHYVVVNGFGQAHYG